MHVANPCLVTKTLPPLKYACFLHRGSFKDRALTLNYAYQTWLPRAGWRPSSDFELDLHGPGPLALNLDESEWQILIPVE